MAAYRLYHLDGSGRVSTGEWIEAEDDAAAVEAARTFHRPVELWQGNRLVVAIDADGAIRPGSRTHH